MGRTYRDGTCKTSEDYRWVGNFLVYIYVASLLCSANLHNMCVHIIMVYIYIWSTLLAYQLGCFCRNPFQYLPLTFISNGHFQWLLINNISFTYKYTGPHSQTVNAYIYSAAFMHGIHASFLVLFKRRDPCISYTHQYMHQAAVLNACSLAIQGQEILSGKGGGGEGEVR